MEFERPPTLRTGPAEGAEGAPAAPPPAGGFGVNALAELVDEGIASGEGIARMLAARHQLPLVDLPLAGVEAEAAQAVPLHVLERIVAIPYAIENGYLRVAVADPANLHGIDELRLATRYPLELAVAPRDDVLAEIRRLVRASEAFAARPARQLGHLPGRRGRRLRHPLRAPGGRARRPLPDRRRAPGGAADPEAHDAGGHDAPEGARQARHRRAAQAAGRPHLAERRGGRPDARRPCRDA